MKRIALVLFFAALFPLFSHAQPLADRVPQNAIVYFGWQGSQSMPPQYAQSHLKAILDQSDLPTLLDEYLPRVAEQFMDEDEEFAQAMLAFAKIGGPIWRYPTACYFTGFDISKPRQPRPKAAIICQAGDEADALQQQISQLMERAGTNTAEIRLLRQQDLVILAFGIEAELLAEPANSIAANDNFKQALTQVQKTPVLVGYADIEALLTQIDELIAKGPDQEARDTWPKLKDAFGVSAAKRLIFTGGFDGPDWATQAFLDAPKPRTGMLAFAETPISDQSLKTVPQSAAWFAAMKLDLAAVVDQIRTGAGKVDPQARQTVDQGLAAARMAIGADLQQQLFAALGDEWVIYADPESAGHGLLGITLVNRLRDTASAQRSMGRLEIFINNFLAGNLDPDVEMRFTPHKIGEMTLHYISLPGIAPTWTIVNDTLIVGAYPQVVIAAADALSDQTSILDNASFVALRNKLGPNASDLYYADTQILADEAYQAALMISQLLVGAGDMNHMSLPPLVVPPLNRIRAELTPTAGFSWADDAGWRLNGRAPIPGAQVIGPQTSIGIAAMVTAVALPAVNSARERAHRVQSAANLRQIGQGIMLYRVDNKKMPADLGQILTNAEMSANVFINSAWSELPPEVEQMTSEQQAEWVNANSDYIYIGASLKGFENAEHILAYEDPEKSGGEGINVLYMDGHVEWRSDTQAIVNQAQAQVGGEN